MEQYAIARMTAMTTKAISSQHFSFLSSLEPSLLTITDTEPLTVNPDANKRKRCPPCNKEGTQSYQHCGQGRRILKIGSHAKRRLAHWYLRKVGSWRQLGQHNANNRHGKTHWRRNNASVPVAGKRAYRLVFIGRDRWTSVNSTLSKY